MYSIEEWQKRIIEQVRLEQAKMDLIGVSEALQREALQTLAESIGEMAEEYESDNFTYFDD